MNGSQLVGRVAERTGLSRRKVRSVVDAALAEIITGLSAGERVTLSGFGTFDVRQIGERTGRHPRTGDRLIVPPRRAVVFRAGRELQDTLQNTREEATSAGRNRSS